LDRPQSLGVYRE